MGWLIALTNPMLWRWVNYFRMSRARRSLAHLKHWIEKDGRRHLVRMR